MNLLPFLMCVILGVFSYDQETLDRVVKEAETHFGRVEDFPNFQLKEEKFSEEEYTAPYNQHKIHYEMDPSDSSYNYRFNTYDLSRFEKGEIKNVGKENILVVQGKYEDRVVNKDGVNVVRTFGYIADEKGFNPFLINLAFALSASPNKLTPVGPGAPQVN